jgi:hypothetical protein
MTNPKESISSSLYDALAVLEQGDQEQSESQLSALMGDVRRLVKQVPHATKGSVVRTPRFVGDQFGLDHAVLVQLEAGIGKAQSFTRGRDLKSAASATRQAFDDWTR